MQSKFYLLYAACFSAVLVQAAPPRNLPDNMRFNTLENGLQVLTIQDPSVPLVTIEIAVHNGAYTESPEYDGLSHLYEHMFFKANKAIPSQEKFMERVNELGIQFNGTTSEERVNYFITLSKDNQSQGLEFMNNAIRYPLFLEEEMKNENPVVDGEFQRAESNPVFFLMNDVNKALYDSLYSRRNVIGDHDIILTATTEKMKTIQEKYYHPNNSILVVAGDINHDETLAEVKKYFGDWPKSSFDPFEKYPVPEFEPLKESELVVTKNENAQVPIMLTTWLGPETRKDLKSTYAADVFSFILSQKTHRFRKNLVDSGLAFEVGLSYQTQMYAGPIQLFFVPNPSSMQAAIQALEAEIAAFDEDDYFTDEQLETAKNQLAISDLYGQESTSDYVHTLTFWWASADLDYYFNYVEDLKKVTREDIQQYVRKYIQGKPNVTGVLISPAMEAMIDVSSLQPIKN